MLGSFVIIEKKQVLYFELQYNYLEHTKITWNNGDLL